MKKIGFFITDWIFFFEKESYEKLKTIVNKKENMSELITWKLIIVYLPLITFFSVFLINLLINIFCYSRYYYLFNNGSLPIISFGIITSGMPYLIERLEDYPDFHSMRRRVVAVSMIFLFLTVALYIFQTIQFPGLRINSLSKSIITISSIFAFLFAFSIGIKMFLLKSENVKSFDEDINKSLGNHFDAISDD
ncbi:hypothetical protein [Lunatimonas lonarensis]|uniref:hypothetical protein n=1 Tax=Lunatimonas lonarensis TaxID=1232681 RepID=UPI00055B06DC|nr:hypothetical protein [Lunatimonas lonarensis]